MHALLTMATIGCVLLITGCDFRKDQQVTIVPMEPRHNEFVIGKVDAPTTMIVYFDFTCDYCRQLQGEVIDSLKSRYVDQGLLRLVYRPIHDPADQDSYSMLASEATHCAGEENAYPILNYLLSYPLGTGQVWHQTDELATLGSLDHAPYRECLAFHKTLTYTQGIMHRNNQDGILKTPTVFINGTKVEGIRPLDEFVDIIEAALARSKAASE